MDDDTLPNLWRLLGDVLLMEASHAARDGSQAGSPPSSGRRVTSGRSPSPLFAYYGVLRWRRWMPEQMHSCAHHENEEAADISGSRRAFRLLTRAKKLPNGSACTDPYLYADGMLHLMSSHLARAVFSGEVAAAFARSLSNGI